MITNSGTLDGTIHTVHDRGGNVIAELNAAGATVREYIWLPDGGYADTDLPLAVVDGVETASPVLYHVHADHLGRPIRLTDAGKATVWQATWQPRAPIVRAERGRESAAPTKKPVRHFRSLAHSSLTHASPDNF